MMVDVPFNRSIVDGIKKDLKMDPATASIRQMVMLVGALEKALNARYLRMEFGIPGLEPHEISAKAEIAAIQSEKFTPTYPPIPGLPELKEAASEFVEKFLNVLIPPIDIIPTVGSMQGGFLAQALAGRRDPTKNSILFVDPCFSVHRVQCRFLGLQDLSVDLYDRATWLDRVEAFCKSGQVGGLLYSSPNNPTWLVLTETELKRLGEICTKYDVIAIEDSAYLGMDSRQDYSEPGKPPYPPTVARYTDNYILLISGSKIFTYAGQRVGITCLSPKLAAKEFAGLETHFGFRKVWDAFVLAGVYCTTSGVSSTPQVGLAALMRAASQGNLNFVEATSEYGKRAEWMKKVFLKNGFRLVYDKDLDQPLADGFFFTVAYGAMTGAQLVRELLYYGISATTLDIARSSRREAVRACVSLIRPSDYELFESRLTAFARDH